MSSNTQRKSEGTAGSPSSNKCHGGVGGGAPSAEKAVKDSSTISKAELIIL